MRSRVGWIDLLFAPLGFLVIVGAQAWERSGKTLPGEPRYWLAAGVALMVAHVVLRWDAIAEALGPRQLKHGANTAVLVTVMLAILGALNFLANRHTKRFDLTKGARYSLSDQTKKAVQALKDDVTLTYYERKDNMSDAQSRLKDYQALSTRLKVEYVDPYVDPGRATTDEVTTLGTLVLRRGARIEKITGTSEQELTNAIIKVTRDGKKTLCFVEGEGEKDIDAGGEFGYAAVKSMLEKNNYALKKVFLAHEGKVPADCSLLVLSGPRQDLAAPTVDALRAYVKGAGKLLVLLEPELKQEKTPNLIALLKEWNVEVGADAVVDVSPVGQVYGPLTIAAGPDYPYHEITRDFRVMTVYHTARSVTAGTATLEGVTARALAQSTKASWAETDLPLKDPIRMDPDKDRKGPVSVAVVVTVKATVPPTPAPAPTAASPAPSPTPSPAEEGTALPAPPPEGRVAVFGDADFPSNAVLGMSPGNLDFYLNTVAWLTEDPDLISIRVKDAEDQRLFVTRGQQDVVWLVSIVFLPGLFVVLGIASWWRRR